METKNSKVIMNKNGRGNLSPKIGLPVKWLKEMEVTENENKVKLSFEDNKIIIEKESE